MNISNCKQICNKICYEPESFKVEDGISLLQYPFIPLAGATLAGMNLGSNLASLLHRRDRPKKTIYLKSILTLSFHSMHCQIRYLLDRNSLSMIHTAFLTSIIASFLYHIQPPKLTILVP